ncbi:hypothetical protein [Gordonibacter massiliensis (ex Traore et al. 2017)]|uniref:DUF5666 domain-containing protein n=1 Tax=Gordonibacter massiliensis (ex Traore et al. 2017) TaxID=1841863 RepID=A0A842JKB9_9ACTN|nr:hypothetical protein [Gordonibacter massiliensis (ex Traore et al. 2017)]MBC2889649.1 hypothetical protein [Gordonibacter massiliensis (ex Traore et al. 2017)]
MNKRKMRMMGMVLAGVLALTPFLHGCATDNGASNDNGSQNATEQQQNGSEQQNAGSQDDVARYGQVMAVNGDEITVVLGEMKDAQDGSGKKTFVAEEDEITFNKGDVDIVDESGAVIDDPVLVADDVVVMSGTGEGTDYRPSKVEIVDVVENGVEEAAPSASQDAA